MAIHYPDTEIKIEILVRVPTGGEEEQFQGASDFFIKKVKY